MAAFASSVRMMPFIVVEVNNASKDVFLASQEGIEAWRRA
jgi:hypothetical protein